MYYLLTTQLNFHSELIEEWEAFETLEEAETSINNILNDAMEKELLQKWVIVKGTPLKSGEV